MSVIKDFKSMLTTGGITDAIFLAYDPSPDVDKYCVIYGTGGYDSLLSAIDQPTVQITIKSRDYEAGHRLAADIRRILEAVNHTVVNDNTYMAIYRQSDVLDVGYRDGRFGLTINFRCYLENN